MTPPQDRATDATDAPAPHLWHIPAVAIVVLSAGAADLPATSRRHAAGGVSP